MQPLVSVVMSVFNGEKYINNAIQSILGQTYRSWELIIVDDGSNDSTKEIVGKYISDPRVKYFYHENIGLTKSLNRGIRESSGKYIARLDADDRSLPERLEMQVRFLEKHQDYVVVGTYSYNVDMTTMQISIHKPPVTDEGCRKRLKSGSAVFMHSSVMFRKEIGEEHSTYDEEFIEAQDYKLWVTLAAKGKLTSLEDTLCLTLRNLESSITSRRTNFKKLAFSLQLSWIACKNLDLDITTFLVAAIKNIASFSKSYFLEGKSIYKSHLKQNPNNKGSVSLSEINSIWRGDIIYSD